ncbi:MAG: molecular chaperone TorD family protein, partial [Halarsenatibacteraceae bacterium]
MEVGISLEEKDKIREEVYLLFCNLISKPETAIYKELKSNLHIQLFNRYNEYFTEIKVPENWENNNLPELNKWNDLWKEYLAINNPGLKLIESVYKPWTIDESCGMPFADDKGYIMGDWAHHMLHLYELLDFEIPEKFSFCPDHLMLELEFMSILVEEADHRDQLQFVQQHLDWLDDLVEEAEAIELDQFYLKLLIWIKDFIEADKIYLKNN